MKQLTKEERIQLRNELFEELKNMSLVKLTCNKKSYMISNKLKFLNELNNNIQFKEKYNIYIMQFRNEEEAIYCLMHNDDFENHLCPICNNISTFYINKKNYNNKYEKTCDNKKCQQKMTHTKESLQKMKQTNLERWGVEYPTQLKEVKDKVKKTNFERYGYECSSKSPKVKEKAKQTCLEKYGVEHQMKSKSVKNKFTQTMIDKYGVEHALLFKEFQDKAKKTNFERYGYECSSKSPKVKEKAKQTCLEKYGVENPFQYKEFQEKSKQTCIERYGVENPMQLEEIHNKMIKTNLERYGVKNLMQNKEFNKKVSIKIRETFIKKNTFNNPIMNNEINIFIQELKNYYKDNNIELSNIYSNNEYFIKFIEIISAQKNRLLRLFEIADIFKVVSQTIKRRCEELNLLSYFFIKDSNLELQFKELLDNNNINNYIRHYRGLSLTENNGRPEIDFLINDNIGIEINDIMGHNIMKRNTNYHYNKTLLAQEKGIRLIHIWEWELVNEKLWERLSRWIINLLNNNKIKIGARKTIIKEIPENIEKKFLNEYHLQGYKKSTICYGLYYNEELIQLMSFTKSRYNKNYQWELLRLCTKYGYIVISGAQKLLKNFIKDNNPNSIISYCYLDKFTGNIYEELGFKLLKRNQPSATWYNEETEDYFLDSSLLKLGADKLLGTNYGKGTNNEEIAYKCGYQKIYNCGINIYIY